jgi:hypothetical protein
MADVAQVREHMDPALRAQLLLGTAGGVLVGIAYLLLPARLSLGPNWVPLALNILIIGPITVLSFFRPVSHSVGRMLRTTLTVLLTLALASSLILYVANLSAFTRGLPLLEPASLLWLSNILIFALWYWELDGDGPVARHKRGHAASDFLFPQQTRGTSTWKAGFVDYVFLAFCFATALSPADTAPLTQRAKLLMMGEAIASLWILVLLVARSVNIL